MCSFMISSCRLLVGRPYGKLTSWHVRPKTLSTIAEKKKRVAKFLERRMLTYITVLTLEDPDTRDTSSMMN